MADKLFSHQLMDTLSVQVSKEMMPKSHFALFEHCISTIYGFFTLGERDNHAFQRRQVFPQCDSEIYTQSC